MRWTYKQLTLSLFMMMVFVSAVSQDDPGYNVVITSEYCGKKISTYRQFFLKELYKLAHDSWVSVFDECPGASEKMYVDGVTMYHSFIDSVPDGPEREGLIDTLMLIYDRRMHYFGGEGNILGRKGRDLLTYRGSDPDQVLYAFKMLHRSVQLMGDSSRESSLVLLISAGASLRKEGLLDADQFVEDYITVNSLLDRLEKRSSRWERTRATIEEILQKEDVDICEALESYYTPQIAEHMSDTTFLENIVSLYRRSGCGPSDVSTRAAEALYRIAPDPGPAHELAIIFISRNDLEKAAGYLEEAVQDEGTEAETRAQWYYELGVVYNAIDEPCKAIDAARKAIGLKSNFGKAYLLLGDACIAYGYTLDDEFQQHAVFWVVADQFRKAAEADPTLEEERSMNLEEYTNQFPSTEEIFFHDLKVGDRYLVGGCINEYTTVRTNN